jgi:hypothetical protein
MSREQAKSIAPPAPSVAETAQELGQSIGQSADQYLLDQVNPTKQLENLNPLKQIQEHIQSVQTIGKSLAESYSVTKDLFTRADSTERLQQAAGLDTSNREAVELLHRAAGVEPIKDEQEAIERLNKAAGIERSNAPTDLAHTTDKALEPMPELTPALEQAVVQEVEEHVIEHTIELLL